MPATNTPMGSPLSSADLSALNQAIYLLNNVLTKLDQAEAAGFDVTAARMRRDDAYEWATRIKATYFPSST